MAIEKYLRNRLDRVRDEIGEGQFHSFYKTFLRSLFHDGLGKPKDERAFSPALQKLIGEIPYLNGGIFEEHRIEREYPDLHIPDKAFDRVFTFLDQFDWHLDDRPIAKGNEINPEILGYVFEKYTNQKEMGAYYTKEDITDYIAKNCILPFLLDAARDKLGDAAWNLLREDPDRYIYPAVGHGIFCDYPTNTKLDAPLPLPDYIQNGIDTSKSDLRKRRARWNEPATPELGLPTEIWRETVARRQRCEELRRKLRTGEVRATDDLITLNLNIRQFAQDVVENAAPDLLLALFKGIRNVSVLDPTCGSGAFLFAALNILEPLYRASLERMRALLGDWEARSDKSHPNYRKEFAAVLDQAARHPNENYFIFKSIIVHNLYGVDIMEEAVEICKLRLFLKLAAQLEPGQEIEPLPDIDFNIRVGNTLVGYVSRDEVRRCMTQFGDGQMRLGVEDELQSYSRFEEAAENVDKAFDLFQQMQDEFAMDAAEFREQKRLLAERLQTLRNQLDRYLASDYGVNVSDRAAYQKWLRTHQPFHWLVEFYGIMSGGGFDVIIGNPPYVNAAKVRKAYTVKNLATLECPDIYAWMLERISALLRSHGRSGMIVPLSLGFSGAFAEIRKLLYRENGMNWFSSFGRIPSALFSFDVRVRNTIHLGKKSRHNSANYTTRLHRWFEAARQHLFPELEYASFNPELWHGRVPKWSAQRLVDAFERQFKSCKKTVANAAAPRVTPHVLHFKKTAYNWLNFCRKLPPCYEGTQLVSHTKFGEIHFADPETYQLTMLLADGKLMLTFWFAIADDFDVTRWNFADFPADFAALNSDQKSQLLCIFPKLETAMDQAVQFKLNAGRRVGNYNLAKCRYITDRSDAVFAKAWDFESVWDDIELHYSQTVKTDFSDSENGGVE